MSIIAPIAPIGDTFNQTGAFMKSYLRGALALSAIALASHAAATCQNGGVWPACTPPVVQPVAPAAISLGQGQDQQQHQGMSQGQGQSSTSSATGGNASATGGAGGLATANGSVSVSTGGNTDNSRATAWAPVIHGPGAAAIAGAGIVTMPGDCGPRVTVVRTAIQGKRFGALGGQSDVDQGFDEVTAPSEVPYIDRGGMRFGHQVTTFASVLGTSSAGSFSLGGFGRSGDGAQGGVAGSGGMQQMVMRVTVRECVMAIEQPFIVPEVRERVVYLPAPACVPARAAHRKPIKRKAACPVR